MNNMDLYTKFKTVPQTAQKQITGGRLNGMTDINPMWRIKVLTEQFGPCGIGWKYKVIDKRLEKGGNDEIAVFVDIELYIKDGETWSEAIPGTGGSMFVAKETRGLYTSDECFKMALTDALSVACKALGVAADIYYEKDRTKYDSHGNEPKNESPKPTNQAPSGPAPKCKSCDENITKAENDYSIKKYGAPLCRNCQKSHGGQA